MDHQEGRDRFRIADEFPVLLFIMNITTTACPVVDAQPRTVLKSLRSLVRERAPAWTHPVASFCERGLIRLLRTAIPPRWPKNSEGKVYLNLGCGNVTHPAFVNVDALVAWHIHYISPVEKLRPFRDNSADIVYASHCVEHFSHLKVNEVLAEWRRVLKPGGVLRLGVPDFDLLVALYEASARDIEAIQLALMGGQTYPLNAHFTAFTRKSLTDRLVAAGFSQVRRWERNTDELTSLPDFTALPVSLNLEAVK